MRHISAGLLLLCLTAVAQADHVVVYGIDPVRTVITFNWTSFGLTSPSGHFSGVDGRIYGNLDHPQSSWVDVRVPVRTLKTVAESVDRKLLDSGDFFKPREYPEILFHSDGILSVDRVGKSFTMPGTLTVNGISRPVLFVARLDSVGVNTGGKQEAVLSATSSFSRSEFGMTSMPVLVGDHLLIQLKICAVEKSRIEVPYKPPASDFGL